MTWAERIDAAEKRGGFTTNDLWEANGWSTCACCELNIPKSKYMSIPEDLEIQTLGRRFMRAVKVNNFMEARRIHAELHVRAAALQSEQEVPVG